MSIIKKLFTFINPIAQLGKKNYSYAFPFFITLAFTVLSEFIANVILQDPESVGIYAIFIFVALIIYFAFRDGIRGGFIASVITIGYYFYIIYSRGNTGTELQTAIQTVLVLGALYLVLAWIIGWLKQNIDSLIERESDEKHRLQAIVQQMPIGVLITDNKGKIVQVNKKVDQILGRGVRQGIESGTDMLTSTIRYKEDNVKQRKWPLEQTLASGKAVVDKEFLIKRKDGKKIYLQISASVIKNKIGKIIAATSIINDITTQKEMEERKDDFVNMASHELKTPITSMKLYIDSLSNHLKKTDDEKVLKTIKSVKYQIVRLQELVSDLLDVSRLQTGKLSFHKERFNLEQLIKETIDELQGATNQQEIIYRESKPLYIQADKFRIYQVVTNLITNAIKYSPAKKDIVIKLKRFDGKALVSVQDFGIGIAKEQQKKIFERLYQVTDPKEKTFPGFGMGLYISKEIIKRHKGNIWVESEKGGGSTFYFTLPLQTKSV